MTNLEITKSMVNGQLFHNGGTWFGINLALDLSVDKIINLLNTYPKLVEDLEECNKTLRSNGNSFNFKFKKSNHPNTKNRIHTATHSDTTEERHFVIEILNENSDSVITELQFQSDDIIIQLEEAKDYFNHLQKDFTDFVVKLNKFLIIAMLLDDTP